MGFWGVVNNCIKNADLILLILDARIPEETKNKEVEKKANQLGKEVVYIYNKSDLVSKSRIKKMREESSSSFFVSSKNKHSVCILRKFLDEKGKGRERALRVALIGYPNVGKSSLFNLLVPEARAKVSSVSGTTRKTEWIRSEDLRFMDSPGVIPRSDSKIQVGITASKDPHKMPHPEKVAIEIIRKIRKKEKEILKRDYNITFDDSDSDYEILLKIGEKKKLLVKGGEIDEHRAGVMIVDDWQKGKLGLK